MKATMPVAQKKWIARADWRPPEQVEQPGGERIEAGRHTVQAGKHHQDHQRDQAQVGQSLQDVVALGRLAGGVLRAGRGRGCRARNGPQVGPRRPEISPEVTAQQAPQQVDQAVGDEDPGEEEMPVAGVGEILVAGDGQPRGPERSSCRTWPSVRGNAEEAGRVERFSGPIVVTPRGAPAAPAVEGVSSPECEERPVQLAALSGPRRGAGMEALRR